MTSEDRLLKASEVARLLNVSHRAVTGWAQDGRIPAVRTPGGHWRFRPSDIDALCAATLTGDGDN